MDNKLIEDLKLVATYMGYTYYPHTDVGGQDAGWKTTPDTSFMPKHNNIWNQFNPGKTQKKFLCRNHNQLRYNTDWNWFHEAWEKALFEIEEHSQANNFTYLAEQEWSSMYYDASKYIVHSDIEEAFQVLVRVITWYNKKKEINAAVKYVHDLKNKPL